MQLSGLFWVSRITDCRSSVERERCWNFHLSWAFDTFHLKARDSTFPSATFKTITFLLLLFFSPHLFILLAHFYYWLSDHWNRKTLSISNRLLKAFASHFKSDSSLKMLHRKTSGSKTMTYLSTIFSHFLCNICIKDGWKLCFLGGALRRL